LYKNVLSILNKLTWTTFDQLVDEFQKLPIENAECLENIANIVALKVNKIVTFLWNSYIKNVLNQTLFQAFDEPSFGSLYASLCRVLDITISCQSGSHVTYQMSFKKCVITVCQNYFQKQCLDDTDIVMSVEHEQNQRRVKMQTIGCVRYIT